MLPYLQFGLPICLSYILFVGISGQFFPFAKPENSAKIPAYRLAQWISLCVMGILFVATLMVYDKQLEDAKHIIKPLSLLLALLVIPAIAIFFLHRRIAADDQGHHNTLEIDLLSQRQSASEPPAQLDMDELIPDAITQTPEAIIDNLRSVILIERSMREETEKHLLITRKALAKLENDAEFGKFGKHITSNAQRADSTHPQSDSAVKRSRQPGTQHEVSDLRKSLANAKQEIRRGIAARAKALSTANQSVALARQALKTRARLETELVEAKTSLATRQAAVSSLIRALDRERNITAEQVSEMAKAMAAEASPSKEVDSPSADTTGK